MTRPTILVTGATSKTGGAVARQLLSDDWPVRALVHAEDARSEALRRSGAEVVVADMFYAEQLKVALQGVQRAYYVTLFKPGLARAAQAFQDAARQARLETVVQLSQWLSHPTHRTRDHMAQMEEQGARRSANSMPSEPTSPRERIVALRS